MAQWTGNNIEQLKALLDKHTVREVSKIIGRSEASVTSKMNKLSLHSKVHWAEEDIQYLENSWGKTSITAISKRLGRSQFSIKIKAQKLGLGAFLDSGNYITVNSLLSAFGSSYSYKITSWVENRSLPVKYQTVEKSKWRVIDIDDFWKWAEKNKSFLDFTKLPKNALGKEPKWVDFQRKARQRLNIKIKTTKWTRYDDEQLIFALRRYKYTCREIASMLGRTEGAVMRRISELKLKERPLRENPHNYWTIEQFETLDQCIAERIPYPLMSEMINKSEKAIRGKVYAKYGTENLDKAYLKIKEVQNDLPTR